MKKTIAEQRKELTDLALCAKGLLTKLMNVVSDYSQSDAQSIENAIENVDNVLKEIPTINPYFFEINKSEIRINPKFLEPVTKIETATDMRHVLWSADGIIDGLRDKFYACMIDDLELELQWAHDLLYSVLDELDSEDSDLSVNLKYGTKDK